MSSSESRRIPFRKRKDEMNFGLKAEVENKGRLMLWRPLEWRAEGCNTEWLQAFLTPFLGIVKLDFDKMEPSLKARLRVLWVCHELNDQIRSSRENLKMEVTFLTFLLNDLGNDGIKKRKNVLQNLLNRYRWERSQMRSGKNHPKHGSHRSCSNSYRKRHYLPSFIKLKSNF